tara:strand:+ start:34891 stop:36258 length:1368 start_codon:yes stop_codon:yes gene_type:complete
MKPETSKSAKLGPSSGAITQDGKSLTEGLVDLIRAKPVSQPDYESAALFTLDAVANILAGRNSAPGRVLMDWWQSRASNEAPEPSRLGFLMGALCHILETDDLHRASVVHPGCVVVPAAWALGTKLKVSGQELLRSVLEGFEATTRVGMAVGAAHYRIWHNTATCGPYGSAMAAARLLGLDDAQTVHALGNAGSQSSGLWQFLETGAMTKHLHAGHAVEAGMKAADLAAFGFTGPPKILEGEKGFFKAACPDAKPEMVLGDADADWQLVKTSIKPWPSCRHTHPAIDAAEELRIRLGGVAEDAIARVSVTAYQAALDVCNRPVANSEYEAKFSLQHAVAAALLLPKVDFAAFGDEGRAKAAQLALRVDVAAGEPYLSAYPRNWGSFVQVELKDGSVLEAARENAKGDPEAPLNHDDMVAKAQMLLAHGGVKEADRLIEAILGMAKDGAVPDLSLL